MSEEAADDVIKLADECRRLQRLYFRDRTPTLLREAKDAERRLDAALEAYLRPEAPGLFDDNP
jgi:hypothetical protein